MLISVMLQSFFWIRNLKQVYIQGRIALIVAIKTLKSLNCLWDYLSIKLKFGACT